MNIVAIRGAITIDSDSPEQVGKHTVRLFDEILNRNSISAENMISIFFTVTSDITSLAPATALRSIGISDIPLLCAQEMHLKNSLPLCIRTFIHTNYEGDRSNIQHVFLRKATILRPDLAREGDEFV